MNTYGSTKADETLDVRKKVCPMPVLLTKRKLQTMQAGAILEVIGDYAQAVENIQRFAKQEGHLVLKVTKGSGTFDIYIKKTPTTMTLNKTRLRIFLHSWVGKSRAR